MKRKIILLVTLAVALCAPAHAQNSGGDWEQSSQVQIKCVKGHNNCTLTHQNDTGDGGIVDLGSNSGGNTGSDTISDNDERPTRGNSRVGDEDTISDTDQENKTGNGETDVQKAERLAREECERLERANRRIEAAKDSGNEEELRRATQEMLRAQDKMRTEMERKMDNVRSSATGASSKLQSAVDQLKVWQKAMVEAGLKKEVAEFYVKNKDEIGQLLIAFGDSKKPGPLRWLAANHESIKELVDAKGDLLSMRDDHQALDKFYANWQAADGKSYSPLMKMAKNVSELDDTVENLKGSLGAEWWVKVLAILGPILAILAFVLRKK